MCDFISQADVDKASHKTRKASEQIEAEMAALDHEKTEPRLPLGIQLERFVALLWQKALSFKSFISRLLIFFPSSG